jgi:hypothetical protein
MLTPKTQLEKDLAEKDAGIIRAATALHYAGTVIAAENAQFWALPQDRLLAILNDNVERTLAMFAANSAAANAINSLLDQIDNETLSHRVPTAMPANWVFENGAFAYAEPQLEPQPEPELQADLQPETES